MTTAPYDTARQGLASAAGVEALADQLTALADALHARVMRDIRGDKDGDYSADDMAVARALLDDEQLLRQRANRLYADAAACVVQGLGPSQDRLAQLTAAAAEHIRSIGRIADVSGLVGGVLGLAGAVATGQAGAIVAAVGQVSKHIEKIAADTPNKAA